MGERKVLIINGDISEAEVVFTRLKDAGYCVKLATTYGLGMEILENEWVDLIILSTSLRGEMDGYQLIKKIKSNSQFKEIPVIVESDKPTLKNFFEQKGALAFFVKPYPFEKLVHEVQSILEGAKR